MYRARWNETQQPSADLQLAPTTFGFASSTHSLRDVVLSEPSAARQCESQRGAPPSKQKIFTPS